MFKKIGKWEIGDAVISRVCGTPKNESFVFGRFLGRFWEVFGRTERTVSMRSSKYKGRCEKVSLSKCEGVCRTYSPIQLTYAKMLEEDDAIASIRCNVALEGLLEGSYTSDFVCIKTDGDLMVRECVYRSLLIKPKTAKLLEESRQYWLKRGVSDWGLVVNEE